MIHLGNKSKKEGHDTLRQQQKIKEGMIHLDNKLKKGGHNTHKHQIKEIRT